MHWRACAVHCCSHTCRHVVSRCARACVCRSQVVNSGLTNHLGCMMEHHPVSTMWKYYHLQQDRPAVVRAWHKYLAECMLGAQPVCSNADAVAVAVGAKTQIRFACTGDRSMRMKQLDLLERRVLRTSLLQCLFGNYCDGNIVSHSAVPSQSNITP